MLQFMGSQRVGYNRATELNWRPHSSGEVCWRNCNIFHTPRFQPLLSSLLNMQPWENSLSAGTVSFLQNVDNHSKHPCFL